MGKKGKYREFNKGEIVIYKPARGEVELKVRLEDETVWLDAHQMAAIFGVNRPAIVKHVNNIYIKPRNWTKYQPVPKWNRLPVMEKFAR